VTPNRPTTKSVAQGEGRPVASSMQSYDVEITIRGSDVFT
jgi:hypothetical protein